MKMENDNDNGSKATFVNAKYRSGKKAVVEAAKARKSGGRVDGGNQAKHATPKEVGKVDGGNPAKHAGRANRTVTGGKGVHGMPLMSSASCKS